MIRRPLIAGAVLGLAVAANHAPAHHPVKHASPVKYRKHAAATTAAPDVVPPRPTPTAVSRDQQRKPITSKNPTAEAVPNVEAHGQVLDVTAYCWTGSRTASGVWPERGMAAGNDWPFGTVLQVEDVGRVTVTDRYGYGTQLDIYIDRRDGNCEHDAAVFGRRQLHVEVMSR